MTTTEILKSRGFAFNFGEPIRDANVALKRAGLDFTVESVPLNQFRSPLQIANGQPAGKYSGNFYAAVRSTDGAFLGVNSKRFHHFQPSVLAEVADLIMKFRPGAYVSGGGLSADERMQFLIVTLDEGGIRLGGAEGEEGMRTILLANSTNGGSLLSGYASTARIGCMNQFPSIMGRKGHQLFGLRHTVSHARLIGTAHESVIEAIRLVDQMDMEIEMLLNTPCEAVRQDFAEALLGEVPKEPRARDSWTDRWCAFVEEYTADWNEGVKGTAWGAVMAAQGADEHRSRCRRGQRDQARVRRIISADYPMMSRALELVGGGVL